jgi:predicted DNA-binding transcriptional regulator AlpA
VATDYMNAQELEELTGIAASTFYYWALNGDEGPPSVKLGRRRVWKRSSVQTWLAQREQQPPTES